MTSRFRASFSSFLPRPHWLTLGLFLLGAQLIPAQVLRSIAVSRLFVFEQTATGIIEAEGGIQALVGFQNDQPANSTIKLVSPHGEENLLSAQTTKVYSFDQEFLSHAELQTKFPAGEYRLVIGNSEYPVQIPSKEDDLDQTEVNEFTQLQDWGKDTLEIRFKSFIPRWPHSYQQTGLETLDGSRVVATDEPDGPSPQRGGSNYNALNVSEVPDGTYEGYIFWAPFEGTEFDEGSTVVLRANSSLLRFPVTLRRQVPSIVQQPTSRFIQAGVTSSVEFKAIGGHLYYHLFKWSDRSNQFLSEMIYIGDGSTKLKDDGRYYIRAFNDLGGVDSQTFEITVLGNPRLNILETPTLVSGPPVSSAIWAMEISPAGDFYFVEYGTMVRKIDRAGNLSLVAGLPNRSGNRDGTADVALFQSIRDITLAPNGDLYVADTGNTSIRKISPSGNVTTVAGKSVYHAIVDGVGDEARFTHMTRIAFDRHHNRLLVADDHGSILRSVTLEGEVTTLVGSLPASPLPGKDGNLSSATVGQGSFTSFTIDSQGSVIFVDYQTLRAVHSDGQVVTLAKNLKDIDYYSYGTRLVEEPGVGLYYFSNYDLHLIDPVTGKVEYVASRSQDPILRSPRLHLGQIYGVNDLAIERLNLPAKYRIRSSLDDPRTAGRLLNLSVRNWVPPDRKLIVGFVVNGSQNRPMVVRGIGPTLKEFGLEDTLNRPNLTLFQSQQEIGSNSGWVGNDGRAYGAFPLPSSSDDAVISPHLSQGVYTAQLSDLDIVGGNGLVEVYSSPNASLTDTPVNLSARVLSENGNPIIAGFVLGGTARRLVLIRGIGPSLRQFGIDNPLPDPRILLYRDGIPRQTNDNWNDLPQDLDTVFLQAGAFSLDPDSLDAALATELDPGAYTVHLKNKSDDARGEALIEIYVLN